MVKRRTPGGVGLALAVTTAVVVVLAGAAVPAVDRIGEGRAPGDGTVTVRVVDEVDADGRYDYPLETGLRGVRITLTDDRGTVLTRTTNRFGHALFTPAASRLRGGRYRVQVYNPDPADLQPAVAGLGGGADVIRGNVGFVDVSGNRNTIYTTGFWKPGEYCQENPDLVSCSLAKGDVRGEQGLTRFPSDFGATWPGPRPARLTDNTEQRAVFGIGVDRTGNKYLGTSVKRHTEYGPRGAVNAIYRYNDGTDKVSPFVTLPGTLTRHDSTNNYLNDNRIYRRVGREGLGDVDVSGDGRTLYAVNLNDSKLYRVPIHGTGDSVRPGTLSSYTVPKPNGCEGQWHPYGIGVRGKRVLVGGVCGAENTTVRVPYGDPSKLSAHVYEFKWGAFDEIFRHRLDYPRGCAYRPTSGSPCGVPSTAGGTLSAMWEAWNERVPTIFEPGGRRFASAPQPILSNLEIADDGDLILGYRDRFADMQGNATYAYNSTTSLMRAIAAGDVLRACEQHGGGYALERNGSCGPLNGALPGNGLGPGGGEFHNDLTVLSDAQQHQVTQGGTVLQPHRKRLWSTVYDPFNRHPFEQGVRRRAAETGSIDGGIRLQPTSLSSAGLFGKANGLADLEMVCDQAPVQIGNRVWFDTDGNGVQDPSEPPISRVKVTLDPTSSGPNLVTYTDADGEYSFGAEDGLKPNTTYKATFGFSGVDPDTLPGRTSLSSLRWTVKEARSNRAIDSDVDTHGRTTVYVGDPGHVNHTVDAGLTKSIRLTLLKLDEKTGKPLAGAVFELWQDTDRVPGLQRYGRKKDRFVHRCATSGTGRCAFGSLPVGAYYLVETGVPEGYVPPKQSVFGPYVLTPRNASHADGLRVELVNKRGERARARSAMR
ncbi:Cna protein B-type domain protein [Streptomyces ipomoeae 91-03]|uniref:Cna protein B-type domain protein n=1 Tax=Streptomyces ipomoeae 91-03 TaxID=698759 RepID=L1KQX0_9ACTN|nr:Cna protein B-type domain protein [Streptomyces ipomoeae 91-03]